LSGQKLHAADTDISQTVGSVSDIIMNVAGYKHWLILFFPVDVTKPILDFMLALVEFFAILLFT
jgi:hypothetical protein